MKLAILPFIEFEGDYKRKIWLDVTAITKIYDRSGSTFEINSNVFVGNPTEAMKLIAQAKLEWERLKKEK